jgi:subtilase family serine protease
LTQPINEKALMTLKGTVHPLAKTANDRGAAPDGMALDRVQIVLKRSPAQEAALKQLISDMHTPGTASYHKWLTPAQFGQQFGPSDADVATISSWLGAHGFGSVKVSQGKQILEVSGSAGQFRDTFHAQIHKYAVNGQTHYANATDPQIPAALAPVFGGFASLNNFRVKSDVKKLGAATYNQATHKATPQWTVGSSQSVSFALAPGDFAAQYDLNPLYAASPAINGTGQTIAIINDSNINLSLVNNFRTLFGLPANTPTVILDGNDPGVDGINNPDGPNGDSIEAYLDVEWSGAVAPNATIDLVIGADTALESGLILAAEQVVDANLAPVASLSFGSCELNLGSTNMFLSLLWEQAAAQGITVNVSTGDNGSAACDNDNTQDYAVGGQAVSGFASTPYNVAVGGTDFYYSSQAAVSTYWNTAPSNSTPTTSLLSYIPEQPWNDSQYGLNQSSIYTESGNTETVIAGGSGGASNCATGTASTTGGFSACTAGYAKPSWQAAAGVPADKVRDLPDVSLFAADGLNFSYYPICAEDGDCEPATSGQEVQFTGVGGTSASTPSFAGIMALVNQKTGARQGQADFVLYPMATQFPAAFHDVTVGTNSVPCNITVTSAGSVPDDCIAVSNPITITDPTFGSATEGEIGTGTTAEYKAGPGYDLASGLGTIDANQLVTNWSSVKFATSSMTLTPSSPSFAHGTDITISGTVTGTSTTPPTGSVALITTSTEPLQQGQGVFTVGTAGAFTSGDTVNYLPGGTYNISGQYSGDGVNAASTSTPVPITVTPEASNVYFNVLNSATGSTGQTAIGTGSTGIPYGTQLILSGEVVPTTYYTTCLAPTVTTQPASCSATSFGIPTGTVSFTDNGNAIDTAAINAEGDAEFNAPFSVGAHSVGASFPGDNSYNASTGTAITFTVAKATPMIGFSTPASGSTGQATVFTVQVENNSNTSTLTNFGVGSYVPVAPPTGTVTVTGFPGGTLTATLQNGLDTSLTTVQGVASVTLPATTAAGSYSVTVTYGGDANYLSTPASGTITIGGVAAGTATTTTATASAMATSPTAGVNVVATVSSTTTAPTGVVEFTTAADGGASLIGEAILTPASATTSTATLLVNSSSLTPGANPITVQYMGASPTFQPSSTVVSVNDGPNFSLAAVTPAITIAAAGSSGTSMITVTPINGFVGPVTMTCTLTTVPTGATSPPTCTVSSPTVTASGAAMATLTVSTTSGTTAALRLPGNRMLPWEAGAAMAALLFFGVPVRRRSWKSVLGLLMLVAIGGFAAGCGGNSVSATTPTSPTGPTGPTTPSSTPYVVTVTGTGGGATASTTVSVTVN